MIEDRNYAVIKGKLESRNEGKNLIKQGRLRMNQRHCLDSTAIGPQTTEAIKYKVKSLQNPWHTHPHLLARSPDAIGTDYREDFFTFQLRS